MRFGIRAALMVSSIALLALVGGAYGRGAAVANDYGGQIEKDPNTSVRFGLAGTKKHRKVEGFLTNGVSVACNVDAFSGRQGDLGFDKALKVNKKGKFKGRVSDTLPVRAVGVPTRYSVKVSGKLQRKKARGTVSVTLSGGGSHCYSGLLKWKATDPPTFGGG